MNRDLKTEGVELKSLRFVEVVWLDAAAGGGWVSIEGADEDVGAEKCITRGWVMKQDEKQIILCSTLGVNKEGLVDQANTTIAIPSPMVQSIADLPAKKQRVAKKKQPPSEEGKTA